MRRRTLLVLLPIALVAPTGCSAFGGDAAPPEEAMQTARERFDGAKGLHIELTSSGIPQGRNGVSKASGDGVVDASRPAFTGEITGVIDGNAAGVKLIAIGDKTWMSFFTKDYNPIDMKTLGAPNPAKFFIPKDGVSRIVAESTDVTAGDQNRDGKVVLQTYTAKVPAAPIQDLFEMGETAESFDVTYRIEPDSGELRAAEITGEFYEGSTTTYTVSLSEYGKSVTVDEPT